MGFTPRSPDYLLTSDRGVKWYMDVEEDRVHLGASQDCTPIIEANKVEQNSGNSGYSSDKTFRKVASIPVVVQLEWMTKYGVDVFSPDPDQQKKVLSLLNEPEYRHLRTNLSRL